MGSDLFLLFILLSASIVSNNGASGANIVFLHTYASYSHRVSTTPLAEALAARGHSITYLAPMPAAKPNPGIKDIVPKDFQKAMDESINKEFNVELRINKQLPDLCLVFDPITVMTCEALLVTQEFQDWLKTNPKVDLVITDLIPNCGVGLAHKLNAKVILYNTVAFYGKTLDTFQVPLESLTTLADTPYKELSFLNRIKNTLTPLGWLYSEHQTFPALEALFKKYLHLENVPPMQDLLQNVSLVFQTGNFISEQPRSLPPMFVSVPALHVKRRPDTLPQELERFIGSSNEGFVYVSLGTVVVAPNLPRNIQNVFLNSMRAFPQIKFFWRWAGEIPKDKPDNVYMAGWFPQQDLLGHEKIRGFVSQAGRPSTQEALAHGVPMITFPILGDQDFNAMQLEHIGMGINLEIGDVTEQQLKAALTQILYNKTMKDNAKKMSKLFKDLPMEPIDTATWWVEYVLRHDDFNHLKPLARHQTWYERRLLDVWLALLGVGAVTVLCPLVILLVIIRKCFSKSPVPKMKSS